MAKKGKATTTKSHFLAILRQNEQFQVRQVEVAKAVQDELANELQRQADAFLTYRPKATEVGVRGKAEPAESERISFFPIYTLNDRSQIFEVPDYRLDASIEAAAKSPDTVDELTLDEDTIPLIKAFCMVLPKRDSLTIYFQAFEQRRILSPARWTFLQNANTFSRLDRPGFTIGDQIHAIYEDGNVIFRSFAVASRFLNLLNLFNEASNEKVEQVLSHDIFHVANTSSVVEHVDTVMRKQFAAISALGTLDKIKPNAAKLAAADFDINLEVIKQGGKTRIEFPVAKKDQKEMLKFLTEGYYKGPLTGTMYESNSHRPKPGKKKT